MTDEDARRRRLVENERLIREANWEASLEAPDSESSEEQEFQCACGRSDCHERLLLTIAEYRSVHSHPHRFVVAPGHADDEVERVIEHHNHFDVIEKRPEFQAFDPTAPS